MADEAQTYDVPDRGQSGTLANRCTANTDSKVRLDSMGSRLSMHLFADPSAIVGRRLSRLLPIEATEVPEIGKA